MTLKIIVAGLPRTGTMSMKAALEELNYGPCHHLLEPACQIVRLRKSAAILSLPAGTERQRALGSLFEGYEVCIDVPGSACVDDLLALYPDAKVILTTRKSASSWLSSYDAIFSPLASNSWRLLGWWVPGVLSCSNMVLAWNKVYEARFPGTPAPSCEMYSLHTQWVRSITPPENFLDFEVGSDWASLCAFLDKPVPNGSFPRRNERNYLVKVNRLAWISGTVSWILLLCAIWYYGVQMFDFAMTRPFLITAIVIQFLLIGALTFLRNKILKAASVILTGSLLYNAFITSEMIFTENRITCAVVFSCLCVQFLHASDLLLLNIPESSPFDFLDAFNALWNMRDVGKPRQIRNIPPRVSQKSSRPSFLFRHATIFSVSYILLEGLTNAPPTVTPTCMKEFVLIRVLSTAAFWVVLPLYLSLIYSALALVQVAVYTSEPEDWPPLFGNIVDMWSIRRFWGMTWHQTLRNTFGAHAHLISAGLGLRSHGIVARYIELVVVFGLSGVLHWIADHVIGVPWLESGAIPFFLLQAVAIIAEDIIQVAIRRTHLVSGKMSQLIGYLWVVLVMVLTTHLWMDPTGRYVGRGAHNVMLPIRIPLLAQFWTRFTINKVSR